MALTYSGIADSLDTKYIGAKNTGYTLPPGLHEKSGLNLMVKTWLRSEVKVKITNDDIKIKSNLASYKTMKFIKKKPFFLTISGFTNDNQDLWTIFKTATFKRFQHFTELKNPLILQELIKFN